MGHLKCLNFSYARGACLASYHRDPARISGQEWMDGWMDEFL